MAFIKRQTTRITGDPKDDNALCRKRSVRGTSKVPLAKKPRSRPPASLRNTLAFFQAHLPSYSGPYSVGSMDIEVPAENPRTFSNITRKGHHILQLETVLFTLYYPAALGSGDGKDPAGMSDWSRETWLSRPRIQTAKGYAKFAGVPDLLAIPFFGTTTMLTKLRAFRNSPPATHWPPEGNSKLNGYKIKNKQGPPPSGASDEPQFPLLFFSHGLGGSRTAYSTMCGEFASYGFVVCAVEHRDGSGPRTFINHPKESEEWPAEYKEKMKKVDHTEEELKKGSHYVDYIFPKDNPKDTAPNNEKGVDSGLRGAQIELRLAELEEAYRVLREIYEGNGDAIAQQNLRRKGYVGGSSRGLIGVDWSKWKKRFHIDKVTMAGHSFGAATVVEVLRNPDRFKEVQAGIIYDIWGAPVKQPEEDQKHRIQIPILGINSEAFMYWQRNFDAVMALMEEAKDHGAPAFLCTVRGSVHISQSDFSVLYSHITSAVMKATVHPQRAIDLNISASLEFLRDVTEGAGKAIIQRCLTDEELLQTTPLDGVPVEQKPDDEWIAARLKVPNEFKVRFSAKVQRKLKRTKQHGFYEPGNEIWMHCKPSQEELHDWRLKRRCTLVDDSEGVDFSTKEGTTPLSDDVKHGQARSLDASDETSQGASTSSNASGAALRNTWLGSHPALKDSSANLVEPQP